MNEHGSDDGDLKRSREMIRKQNYSEAAEVLQKVLEREPKNERALELLGMARFMGKQPEAARDVFEQLTKINPGHALGWVNLGAVQNRLGEFKKAAESLRRALQKDRKCAEGYYNMGIAQRGLNLKTMAISAYKEAIKLKPELLEAHLNLGNIYAEMKNLGLALQCFQTAVRLDPNSKKAKLSLEKAQLNQKAARTEASPFGRLVDVGKLDRQQSVSGPRVLTATARTEERKLVEDVTRRVRIAAKEIVPLLEDTLRSHLHRLERIVLQSETRMSSAEHVELYSQTLRELTRLRSDISEGLNEVRQHLA